MDNIYEDIEFKEIDRPKKIRKKKHYMLRFLIAAGVIAAVILFLNSALFDVKQIDVEGNHYYRDKSIVRLSKAEYGVNLFFDVDKSAIKENLLKNPYFMDVTVSRKLPSTISIKVDERVQTAAVAYGDQFIVIDRDGTVLRKTDVNPKLTLIRGLTVSKMKVGEKIKAEEAVTLDKSLEMISSMKDGEFYFKTIDVSGIVIEAHIYDNLIVKGTPKQMKKAIESGDLSKVVNNLFKSDTTRGTINLGNNDYMSFSPAF